MTFVMGGCHTNYDIATPQNSTYCCCPTTPLRPLSGWTKRKHGMHLVPGRREERFDAAVPVRLERGSAVARNVSATGIYFVTNEVLQTGAKVTFALEFQDLPGGPIQVNCIARIVRIEKHGGKKGVAAAIQSFEFHRLPENDRPL